MCSLELCECMCSGMLDSGLLAEHILVSCNDASGAYLSRPKVCLSFNICYNCRLHFCCKCGGRLSVSVIVHLGQLLHPA